MAIIPREVWRFCVDQIKLYPLNEAAYHSQLEDIRSSYIEAGMSGPPDQSGIVTYSGESPTTGRYESQESALHSPQLRYLSRCVSIMELVQRDPEISDVLDAIWSKGWRDNALIAVEAKTSARTVARAKHQIVRRVAAGWGLW